MWTTTSVDCQALAANSVLQFCFLNVLFVPWGLNGRNYLKLSTSSVNFVSYLQDIFFFFALMYRLLIECFTKYCVVREAIRHFRALKFLEGGTKVLHNEGNFGDPLSLYLRALCREGIHIFHLSFLTRVSKIFLLLLSFSV